MTGALRRIFGELPAAPPKRPIFSDLFDAPGWIIVQKCMASWGIAYGQATEAELYAADRRGSSTARLELERRERLDR
jgi:hypothetical protein